jgi:hypothetical protein
MKVLYQVPLSICTPYELDYSVTGLSSALLSATVMLELIANFTKKLKIVMCYLLVPNNSQLRTSVRHGYPAADGGRPMTFFVLWAARVTPSCRLSAYLMLALQLGSAFSPDENSL